MQLFDIILKVFLSDGFNFLCRFKQGVLGLGMGLPLRQLSTSGAILNQSLATSHERLVAIDAGACLLRQELVTVRAEFAGLLTAREKEAAAADQKYNTLKSDHERTLKMLWNTMGYSTMQQVGNAVVLQ